MRSPETTSSPADDPAYTVWRSRYGWVWSETWTMKGERPPDARYATKEEAGRASARNAAAAAAGTPGIAGWVKRC